MLSIKAASQSTCLFSEEKVTSSLCNMLKSPFKGLRYLKRKSHNILDNWYFHPKPSWAIISHPEVFTYNLNSLEFDLADPEILSKPQLFFILVPQKMYNSPIFGLV
jgi:hypothetical protein